MGLCIISDDCWGVGVYKNMGVDYLSPFIGIFIHTPDYVKMLENFEEYMARPLTFIKHEQSKFNYIHHDCSMVNIPIGVLGDVEIVFSHYENEEAAAKKWNRRVGRIPKDRGEIFVKMSSKAVGGPVIDYGNNEELYKRFHELPGFQKISFTSEKLDYPGNYKLLSGHGGNAFSLGHGWRDYNIDFTATKEVWLPPLVVPEPEPGPEVLRLEQILIEQRAERANRKAK
jgi:uncharacterized protein (DUF1919 family)